MMIARFGGTRLSGITANTVEQFQTDEMARVSSAGTNKNVSLLKAMLRKGMDWGMVSRELEHSLKRISHLRESNRMRYLSKEECQTLINACEPYLKPIVITALNTGMRKSEILNLKWERVDLRHGFILLGNDTKNGERREIPLNDSMRATLQRLTRRLDIPYVFCNPATGKPYTKDLKRSFHTAMRRAGIKDFRFHDLRHTFASHLVMAGVDITTVSRLLGHKSLTMTLRYSHLAPSHLTEAVRKIENYYDFTTVAGVKEKVNAAGKV